MKNLLILIALILIVAFTGQANAGVKRLSGELVNEGETLVVYTRDGRIEIKSSESLDDCFSGEYEVSIGAKGDEDLQLIGTVFCRGKGKAGLGFEKSQEAEIENAKGICPMIYAPVCGMVNGVPHTFGNTCELTQSSAKKLFLGSCEQAINTGIKGHQDLPSFEIHLQ